jgi:hypothetical protein
MRVFIDPVVDPVVEVFRRLMWRTPSIVTARLGRCPKRPRIIIPRLRCTEV